MSSEFIRKVFERDREARASIASFNVASFGFGFGAIVNLVVVMSGLGMDVPVVDYLSLAFFFSCLGLCILCTKSLKKAKEYKLNLEKDPHKYIKYRPPYPWHWWFNSPTGGPFG